MPTRKVTNPFYNQDMSNFGQSLGDLFTGKNREKVANRRLLENSQAYLNIQRGKSLSRDDNQQRVPDGVLTAVASGLFRDTGIDPTPEQINSKIGIIGDIMRGDFLRRDPVESQSVGLPGGIKPLGDAFTQAEAPVGITTPLGDKFTESLPKKSFEEKTTEAGITQRNFLNNAADAVRGLMNLTPNSNPSGSYEEKVADAREAQKRFFNQLAEDAKRFMTSTPRGGNRIIESEEFLDKGLGEKYDNLMNLPGQALERLLGTENGVVGAPSSPPLKQGLGDLFTAPGLGDLFAQELLNAHQSVGTFNPPSNEHLDAGSPVRGLSATLGLGDLFAGAQPQGLGDLFTQDFQKLNNVPQTGAFATGDNGNTFVNPLTNLPVPLPVSPVNPDTGLTRNDVSVRMNDPVIPKPEFGVEGVDFVTVDEREVAAENSGIFVDKNGFYYKPKNDGGRQYLLGPNEKRIRSPRFR